MTPHTRAEVRGAFSLGRVIGYVVNCVSAIIAVTVAFMTLQSGVAANAAAISEQASDVEAIDVTVTADHATLMILEARVGDIPDHVAELQRAMARQTALLEGVAGDVSAIKQHQQRGGG